MIDGLLGGGQISPGLLRDRIGKIPEVVHGGRAERKDETGEIDLGKGVFRPVRGQPLLPGVLPASSNLDLRFLLRLPWVLLPRARSPDSSK